MPDPSTPHPVDDVLTRESRLLVAAGLALMGCQTDDEVFDVVRDYLVETVPGAIALVNRSTGDPGHIVVHAVTGMDASMLARAASLAGFGIVGKRAVIAEKDLDRVFVRSLQRFAGGFEAYVAGYTPAAVAKLAKKLVGFHDVHIIGITDGSRVFGNISILTREPDAVLPAYAIESLTHMAFLTLSRIESSRELAESEERHRAILNTAMDGFWLADIDGRLLEVNDAYCRMSGYSAQELLALRIADMESAESVAATAAHMQGIMARGEDRFESRHRRKDGSVFDFEASVQYRPIEGGRFVVFVRDITERKRAEEALRERKEFIETVLDNAPIGFAVNTIDDGASVFVGRSFREIYGLPPNSVGGVDEYFEKVYLDPAQREQMRERVMEDMASGDVSRMRWENVPITTQAGEHKVVTAANIPLIEQNLMISTVQDVTERWRAEKALQYTESRFRLLFDQSPDGIVILDPATARPVEFNEMAHRQLGYTREEFAQLKLSDIEDMETPEETRVRIDQLMDEGRSDFETRQRMKSGEIRDVLVTAQLVKIGEQSLYHCVWRDITERKRSEEEILRLNAGLEQRVRERTDSLSSLNRKLIETNLDLEEATRAKSDFLAAMSHELRTPLNSIIGFSGILSQGLAGPMTGEQSTQVEMVNRSGRHLLSLIDGVLDLAKVEAGRVDLVVEPVDPVSLAREVVEAVRPLAGDKGLYLEAQDVVFEGPFRSDAGKLRQILFNLVGNAVKFTEHGGVHISLYRETGGACVFSIADTGIGIGAEDLQRIFEPFTQLASPTVAKPKGTGLGLRISREYAHLLGGEITVVSEPGVGSVFTLRLPIEPPASE